MSDPQKPPPTVQPGAVIAGKYRVDGVLGSGGMGVVLAATHLDLDRRVAVKVMRAEPGEHPGAVQRLLLEAKLAAQFRSEHVCKVLDVGTLDNGAPYIVMEYLEGADLAALLARDGVFEIEAAVDLLLEACEALAEAHAAEVVHRDLKPGNLFVARLLDGSPTIKVLDFGISKQVGPAAANRDLTNPSAALGSPYYMAPEQMLSARDVDRRADVWAVGAILFELLTAVRPFEGQTLPEVCAAVMNTAPKRVTALRPGVPAGLADAIQRCLQKDRGARFDDVAQLAAALSPFGSAKAELSRRRIERILDSGAPLGNASLKRLERVLASSGAKNLADKAPDEALGTLTAGAATAAVGAQPPKTTKRSLALAALAAVAVAVTWPLWKGSSQPAPAAPAAATRETSRPMAVEPAPAAVPPRAPAPIPTIAEPAAEERPPIEPLPRAPTAKPPRLRATAKIRQAEAAPPRAAASAAPAPPAADQPRAPVDAWDPSTFGPRR